MGLEAFEAGQGHGIVDQPLAAFRPVDPEPGAYDQEVQQAQAAAVARAAAGGQGVIGPIEARIEEAYEEYESERWEGGKADDK